MLVNVELLLINDKIRKFATDNVIIDSDKDHKGCWNHWVMGHRLVTQSQSITHKLIMTKEQCTFAMERPGGLTIYSTKRSNLAAHWGTLRDVLCLLLGHNEKITLIGSVQTLPETLNLELTSRWKPGASRMWKFCNINGLESFKVSRAWGERKKQILF